MPSTWASASSAATAFRASSSAAAAAAVATVPTPSGSRARPAMHRGVARVLGRLDPKVQAATRSMAEQLQWEYDDEYDDSFDGLQTAGRWKHYDSYLNYKVSL